MYESPNQTTQTSHLNFKKPIRTKGTNKKNRDFQMKKIVPSRFTHSSPHNKSVHNFFIYLPSGDNWMYPLPRIPKNPIREHHLNVRGTVRGNHRKPPNRPLIPLFLPTWKRRHETLSLELLRPGRHGSVGTLVAFGRPGFVQVKIRR